MLIENKKMYRLALSTVRSGIERIASRSVCFSTRLRKLDEFFDDPKNYGEISVHTGRPWMKEELRRKSNEDLHKLWYVLLKERNMLMTMQEEYYRLREQMPNPERFEKVEESMENLLGVVQERDRAVSELESGSSPHPPEVWRYDELGRPVRAAAEEHYTPRKQFLETFDWTTPFLRAEREKRIEARRRARKAAFKRREKQERDEMLFQLGEEGTIAAESESKPESNAAEKVKSAE